MNILKNRSITGSIFESKINVLKCRAINIFTFKAKRTKTDERFINGPRQVRRGADHLWCFCSRWMVRRQDSKSSYRLFIPIPTIIRQFIWRIRADNRQRHNGFMNSFQRVWPIAARTNCMETWQPPLIGVQFGSHIGQAAIVQSLVSAVPTWKQNGQRGRSSRKRFWPFCNKFVLDIKSSRCQTARR